MTPTPGKPRLGISEIQKKALRSWFHSQKPRPSHNACIAWYEENYGRHLNQSTISLILSKRYEYLDHGPATEVQRQQPPQWPALEDRISGWLKAMHDDGKHPTGEAIINKSREIWPQLTDYREHAMPSFSQGWLSKFKKRHNARVSADQDGTLPEPPQNVRQEIKALRARCGEFLEEDIYNMDETGLMWRKAPYEAIPVCTSPFLNREKSRICLVTCTNCTGSDRVPMWIIGHKEMPEALKSVNLDAMQCTWRHDRKAWMTTPIMCEWLLYFYRHVGERRVLLLLDNFFAHEGALEINPPPPNVHVQVFPAHAANVHQPLTLGITQHLKYHYRKQWLDYIIAGLRSGSKPIEKMNLYQALGWITRSWRHDVSNAAVYKSFRRSSLLEPQLDYLYSSKLPELRDLYNEVIGLKPQDKPAMEYVEFINTVEEDYVESGEMAWFDLFSSSAVLDEPVDPTPTTELVPNTADAIAGIQTAMRYMIHQPTTTVKEMQELERLEQLFCRQGMAMNEQNQNSPPPAQPQQHQEVSGLPQPLQMSQQPQQPRQSQPSQPLRHQPILNPRSPQRSQPSQPHAQISQESHSSAQSLATPSASQ